MNYYDMAAAKKRVEKFVSPGVTVEEKSINESPSLETCLMVVLNAGFKVNTNNYSMNKTNFNVNGGSGIEYALQNPSGRFDYTYRDDGTYKESLKKLMEDNK